MTDNIIDGNITLGEKITLKAKDGVFVTFNVESIELIPDNQGKAIANWFYKNKDTIIGCLNQDDASYIYNTGDIVDEIKEILGENND